MGGKGSILKALAKGGAEALKTVGKSFGKAGSAFSKAMKAGSEEAKIIGKNVAHESQAAAKSTGKTTSKIIGEETKVAGKNVGHQAQSVAKGTGNTAKTAGKAAGEETKAAGKNAHSAGKGGAAPESMKGTSSGKAATEEAKVTNKGANAHTTAAGATVKGNPVSGKSFQENADWVFAKAQQVGGWGKKSFETIGKYPMAALFLGIPAYHYITGRNAVKDYAKSFSDEDTPEDEQSVAQGVKEALVGEDAIAKVLIDSLLGRGTYDSATYDFKSLKNEGVDIYNTAKGGIGAGVGEVTGAYQYGKDKLSQVLNSPYSGNGLVEENGVYVDPSTPGYPQNNNGNYGDPLSTTISRAKDNLIGGNVSGMDAGKLVASAYMTFLQKNWFLRLAGMALGGYTMSSINNRNRTQQAGNNYGNSSQNVYNPAVAPQSSRASNGISGRTPTPYPVSVPEEALTIQRGR